MTDPTHLICEHIAEAQAILNDHKEGGRYTPTEAIDKLDALLKEPELLRAMWEVGYFPPNTPPAKG